MPIEMPKGLPFSVDTWSPSSKRKRHHFLTHAHKDHSVGISVHFSYPIYSTHITKSLILQQFPRLDSSLFVGIEVGEKVVIDDPDGTFSVTAFDANHCPGAVMFLFEGNFGHLLHTGDCRLTPECLQNLPEKYIGKKERQSMYHLDYVFLDCTFGKSSIKLPSKYSAIQQVINCIWKHPDATRVYLTCLLGQEEILVEVSRTFGSKIYVDKIDNAECFHAMTLTAPEVLSEDASSRFQVFDGSPKVYERAQAKFTEARANFQPEPLIIRPSAQWYACEEGLETERKQRPKRAERDPFGVWHICYSMHSSREELEWALQLLQPKRVVSTTPTCRAMELDYVKNHCFSTKLAPDDPLWKLMDINTELGSSSPQASTLSELPLESAVSYSMLEGSTPASAEVNQVQPKILSTSGIELRLNLSPPSTRPPITLFGRARQGLPDSNFLHEDKKIVPIKTDFPHISSNNSEEQEIALQESDAVETQFKKPGENGDSNNSEEEELDFRGSDVAEAPFKKPGEKKIGEVKSAIYSCVGSSKSFNESLRKLYRSMNVPVPRPMPSLVELMNDRKRAKRRTDT